MCIVDYYTTPGKVLLYNVIYGYLCKQRYYLIFYPEIEVVMLVVSMLVM